MANDAVPPPPPPPPPTSPAPDDEGGRRVLQTAQRLRHGFSLVATLPAAGADTRSLFSST